MRLFLTSAVVSLVSATAALATDWIVRPQATLCLSDKDTTDCQALLGSGIGEKMHCLGNQCAIARRL
jgi:hypothetical protein